LRGRAVYCRDWFGCRFGGFGMVSDMIIFLCLTITILLLVIYLLVKDIRRLNAELDDSISFIADLIPDPKNK
jgi:uncharacterized membrane protein